MLLYSLLVVVLSIPISIIAIKKILDNEIDKALMLHTRQFLNHIKTYEHLDDINLDLKIWDELTYDVALEPVKNLPKKYVFQTIEMYDSLAKEVSPFRILKAPVEINHNPYILVSRISMVDNNDLLYAIGSVQIALILVLTTGMLWLSKKMSVKLWEPFYNTLQWLKEYELEKSETIKPIKTPIVEFNDLNKTIAHLTERNHKIYNEQKEFIENAAHELQTPLAILQAKLDNLMQEKDLNESSAQTILELEETARRMARLNRNLLLLSKIDNEQYTQQDWINLQELTEKHLQNVLLLTKSEQTTIRKSLQPVTIKANITLIEILLTNLIHNAIRHSGANGNIEIVVSPGLFSVSNTSQNNKLSDADLFKRFSKKSNDTNSTGLGLAIVKRICEVNGYTITYAFTNNMHTFSVHFPAV
jgi:signal transduction histidine kinase